jgi:hypothetical protein
MEQTAQPDIPIIVKSKNIAGKQSDLLLTPVKDSKIKEPTFFANQSAIDKLNKMADKLCTDQKVEIEFRTIPTYEESEATQAAQEFSHTKNQWQHTIQKKNRIVKKTQTTS